MKNRSTMLVAIGAAVFVLGAGVVLLSLRSGGGKASGTVVGSSAVGGADTPVVVVTKAVPAGTTGEALIEGHDVTLTKVAPSAYKADDLTSLNALGQQAIAAPLSPGQPVEASNLRLDAGSLTPPPGDESISITLPSSASGMAGYLAPGDNVDVYANITKLSTPAPPGTPTMPTPCSALIESSVQVLDVSVQVPAERTDPSAGGRQTPGNITVLLAVTPAQARTMVFYTSNESLYLTKASTGEKPVATNACSALLANPQLTPAS